MYTYILKYISVLIFLKTFNLNVKYAVCNRSQGCSRKHFNTNSYLKKCQHCCENTCVCMCVYLNKFRRKSRAVMFISKTSTSSLTNKTRIVTKKNREE